MYGKWTNYIISKRCVAIVSHFHCLRQTSTYYGIRNYESMTFYSTGPRTKVRIAEINKQPFLSGFNMRQNEGDLLNVKQIINA
jgi:hypothetical protein